MVLFRTVVLRWFTPRPWRGPSEVRETCTHLEDRPGPRGLLPADPLAPSAVPPPAPPSCAAAGRWGSWTPPPGGGENRVKSCCRCCWAQWLSGSRSLLLPESWAECRGRGPGWSGLATAGPPTGRGTAAQEVEELPAHQLVDFSTGWLLFLCQHGCCFVGLKMFSNWDV